MKTKLRATITFEYEADTTHRFVNTVEEACEVDEENIKVRLEDFDFVLRTKNLTYDDVTVNVEEVTSDDLGDIAKEMYEACKKYYEDDPERFLSEIKMFAKVEELKLKQN